MYNDCCLAATTCAYYCFSTVALTSGIQLTCQYCITDIIWEFNVIWCCVNSSSNWLYTGLIIQIHHRLSYVFYRQQQVKVTISTCTDCTTTLVCVIPLKLNGKHLFSILSDYSTSINKCQPACNVHNAVDCSGTTIEPVTVGKVTKHRQLQRRCRNSINRASRSLRFLTK